MLVNIPILALAQPQLALAAVTGVFRNRTRWLLQSSTLKDTLQRQEASYHIDWNARAGANRQWVGFERPRKVPLCLDAAQEGKAKQLWTRC